MDDAAAVVAQLERPLRAPADVVARCHLSLPVVTRVAPLLDDGTPFPTRFWLSCPLARIRIGRLEGAGGVQAMDRRAKKDPVFGAALDAAHSRYAAERDAALPAGVDPVPTGGVGGARAGVKCLHAHYADTAAGNDNPVGEAVAPWVEPLDCAVRCVAEVDGEVTRNPKWREPR
jgi:hypothetical protein